MRCGRVPTARRFRCADVPFLTFSGVAVATLLRMSSDDEQGHEHQFAAIEILNAFHDHDEKALTELNAHGRAEQLEARQVFYDYVDAIWEQAKGAGLSPADLPEFDAVAALRDLAAELVSNAEQARANAGEDDE